MSLRNRYNGKQQQTEEGSLIGQLYYLRNGWRLAVDEAPGTGTSSLAILVDVGSRDELPGQWGAAHFLEHLVFKGAGDWDADAIAAASDQLGGEVNAFTTREYTCFYAKVLDALVPAAWELLYTIISSPWLHSDDLVRERLIIREERLEAEDDLDDRVEEAYVRAAFADPAWTHEILGTDSSLEGLDAENLREFHRTWYQPSNLVITVAGDGGRRLADDLRRQWGQASTKSAALPKRPVPSFQSGEIIWSEPREPMHLMVGVAAPGLTEPGFYAAGMLASILGGQNSSRLWRRLREQEGLTYSVHSSYAAYPGFGEVVVEAVFQPKNLKRVLATMREELARLVHEGVEPKEVERARIQWLSNLYFHMETAEGRMLRNGRYALLGITAPEPGAVGECLQHIDPQSLSRLGQTLWHDWERMAVAAVGAIPAAYSSIKASMRQE